jgi:hypothetical protein
MDLNADSPPHVDFTADSAVISRAASYLMAVLQSKSSSSSSSRQQVLCFAGGLNDWIFLRQRVRQPSAVGVEAAANAAAAGDGKDKGDKLVLEPGMPIYLTAEDMSLTAAPTRIANVGADHGVLYLCCFRLRW